MRSYGYVKLMKGAGLPLILASFAITLDSQSSAPAPQAKSETAQGCDVFEGWKGWTKMDDEKLQREMKDLQARVQKEVNEMQPKLSAKLEALSSELASREPEMLARAAQMEARAGELMAQSPLAFSTGDESGWLGVSVAEVTADQAKELKLPAVRGVVVLQVEADSPAAKAGLKEKDVIVRYDDQVVEGTIQFRRLVRETPPGHSAALTIYRDGQSQNLTVEMGDRAEMWEKNLKGMAPEPMNPRTYVFSTPEFGGPNTWPEGAEAFEMHTPVLGISAEDLKGQLGNYFGAPNGEGILVREVRPGTAAERAGLKAGDVIVKVDGRAVSSLQELRVQMRRKSESKSVNLTILRRGTEIILPITIEKPAPKDSAGNRDAKTAGSFS
jgi:serine protease Do